MHKLRIGTAVLGPDFDKATGIGGIRRANDKDCIDFGGNLFDGFLTVCGRVADVFFVGPTIFGNRARRAATMPIVSSTESVVCVTKASFSGSRTSMV